VVLEIDSTLWSDVHKPRTDRGSGPGWGFRIRGSPACVRRTVFHLARPVSAASQSQE
jgi:hypothetical protein